METNGQETKPARIEGKDPKTGQFLPGNHIGNRFVAGNSEPRGRRAVLAWLDEILAEEGSKAKLKKALRDHLDKHPIKFFREIIMPLLPKEARVEMAAQGKVVWMRIRDAFPEPEGDVIDGEAEEVRSDPA